MDLIEGHPLSSSRFSLTDLDKGDVAKDVLKLLLRLSEIGLAVLMETLDYKLGPTIEGIKLFRETSSQISILKNT